MAGVGLALAVGSQSAKADLIFQESFEGGLQAQTSIIGGGNNGNTDFWSVLPTGTLSLGYTPGNIDGTSFFGGRDLNGNFGSQPRQVKVSGIDTSGFTDLILTIALSSRNDGRDYNANDIIEILRKKGAGNFQTVETFHGIDGSGDAGLGLTKGNTATKTNGTLTDFSFNLGNTNNLSVLIDAAIFGGASEAIAFDNIRIEGTVKIPGQGVPEPATMALFGVGLLGLGILKRRRKKAV